MSLINRLQEFYLGYYGRPADPGGLSFWIEQANGVYLGQDTLMASAFGSTDQAEFRNLYGQSPSISAFVSKVYENLFGRPAETEGLASYSGIYNQYLLAGLTEDQARAILIARIIDGASGSDRVAIGNKVSVASAFTDQLQLKRAAISDAYDLARVQEYFEGEGTDAWRVLADGQLVELIESIQANDSVSDYMNTLITAERGVVPVPDASARLSYSRGFLLESDTNTGEIAGTIQITAQGVSFSGNSGDSKGMVSGLPAGLTAKLIKLSDNVAQLSFSGNATSHGFIDSTASISVSFSDEDFKSIPAAEIEGSSKSNVGLGFIDAAIAVSNQTLTFRGEIANNLLIDLEKGILTLGESAGRPSFGAISDASGVDFSRADGDPSSGFTVSFVGNNADNDYHASYLGDSIRALGGDDALTASTGIDTFIFEASAQENGVDTISKFNISSGDILNLSRFLNITGTSVLATQTPSSDQVEWLNGDVLVYQGAGLDSSEDIAGLFDATGSDTSTPFSYPKSDGKAVIITSASTGDASIWYLIKDTNASDVFNSDKSVVLANEIQLVGILQDVNNLSLSPFTSANFL